MVDKNKCAELNADLQQAGLRFQQWIQQEALPLWSKQGFDADTGAHYERLLPCGSPDKECDVRLRVQARQAFSFAKAYHEGWAPRGNMLAASLYLFIEQSGRHDSADEGYTHLLNVDFEVVDQTQDLYDHAFYLLSFAWIHKALGWPEALDRANALLDYLDSRFGSIDGGWFEGDYDADCRRQNPHMHLFEAFLSLYEASSDERWLARASEIFSLFQLRFFDKKRAVLLEFFDEEWQPLAGDKGEIVEPGHMMEWVWLLRWYERLSGRDVSPWANAMYEKALEIGIDADSGLMFDEVTADGADLGSTKRTWPMTEYVKAAIAQANSGKTDCEQDAAKAINLLFKYYLDVPVSGSWIDRRGADNEIISDVAPASTLYHIIVACSEVVAYCDARSIQALANNSAA